MSYLKFEKATMTNLQAVMQKELLRTNRSGAYSCSTLVDCNTRKYHGLFVIPVPEIDDDNHVLLSTLDCSVVQHGVEFNLGIHKYQGNTYSPNGHKYIREFNCDIVPTTIYRVGSVILKKELIFQHFEDRILIRYTLVDGPGETTLRLRPFLAFRNVNELSYENGVASRDYQVVENGIKTSMYKGYPELYMQISKKNEFVFIPDWYRGIEYPKEQERGYAYKEDLYVPGYFEVKVKKGESVVFAASTSRIKPSLMKKLFDEEVGYRPPRDNFYHTLISSAHQFFIRKDENDYILAGYPWFKCRARDMFISLPGLTLAVEETEKFELIMKTAGEALGNFLIGKPIKADIAEIDQPDIPLWAIWAIQQYAHSVGREKCYEKYGKLVETIISSIENGKHENIFVAENNLLKINGSE
ncbi:MAG: glycogen debranching enzyme N-terminal domain-containing protein, partial [Prevotella sp.]|nr:glycogen debranching enzyme N-terminal domain-containing protein [Prevotella sp.]